MGNNCYGSSNKSAAEIVPQELFRSCNNDSVTAASNPTVRLYGPPNNAFTCYIRFALLYKSVKLSFIPSDAPHFGSDSPAIRIGSETISGSRERMLRFIDNKFPHPPLPLSSRRVDEDETSSLVAVRVVALQHKSVLWHLERMLRWGKDLANRGGRTTFDPAVGTPRMELRKFGKSYSQLLEVMLEHAQMEERVLFPILDRADRGLCKASNEEHARDLPIMNGIKEDIKSAVVLDLGSSVCQEALSNLSKRLKLLQEHCKHHFLDEEKNLLPWLEAVELSKEQQDKMLEQLLDLMKQTHSHLLNFFLEGLLPLEALQYLDLITSSSDRIRTSFGTMLMMDAV
ncbi:uncharacterized protein LOC101208874 [Cucumis sativus]|uniref:Hemerythrin-like domain-containing protein n=1 Tax=Cucumis sativus TaxID=3659 RepID=A0A0A0K8J3_CUCSA|nr:uncharacterized protein LOC101208874 [Cucumis sativus]KGN46040.1 hypothetical protein Csa_004996 [Cucumis sativus]